MAISAHQIQIENASFDGYVHNLKQVTRKSKLNDRTVLTSDKSRVRSGKQDQDPSAAIARVAEIVLALSPLGERVARTRAFFSRRGTGEGVDGSMTGLARR